MNKILLTSTLFLLTSNFLFAQDKDSLIQDIQSKYSTIIENLDSYNTTTTDTQTTAYYESENLKLIKVTFLGKLGRYHTEYYFSNEKLIFVFDYIISMDGDKKKTEANRYYFDNEKLVLWLDNKNKEQDLTLGTNSIVGQGLLAHCYKMKDDIKNKK